MADVANLEAAFERTTIHDENDEQHMPSTTAYHKTKVCINQSALCISPLTGPSLPWPHRYPQACRRHNQRQTA
jgi:aurora kinase